MADRCNKYRKLRDMASGALIPPFEEYNHDGRGIVVNLSVDAGSANAVTLVIEGYDEAVGWYTILTSAAIAAGSNATLTVYPGVTPSANVAVSTVIPARFRIRPSHSGNAKYALGMNLIV